MAIFYRFFFNIFINTKKNVFFVYFIKFGSFVCASISFFILNTFQYGDNHQKIPERGVLIESTVVLISSAPTVITCTELPTSFNKSFQCDRRTSSHTTGAIKGRKSSEAPLYWRNKIIFKLKPFKIRNSRWISEMLVC